MTSSAFRTVLLLIAIFSREIHAIPFFYKTATDNASAESQRPNSKSSTNVANLRNPMARSSRIAVNARLNDEDDEFFKMADGEEPIAAEPATSVNETQNEALPSIVQKKIGKILQKLQFISTVRDSVNTGRNAKLATVGEENRNSTSDFDALEKGFDDVDLDEEEEAKKKPPASAFDVTSIGIYLAELIGTAVGLFLGAAAQLTRNQS